jgi:cell shape-determining protein MreC
LASTLELIKRIEVLELANKELRKELQSLNAKASNAKAAIQRNRLSKPLKGRSPKNSVQADMIAKAVDRAIGGDS